MPGSLTEITEIATALGMLGPDLHSTLARRPLELIGVRDETWEALRTAYLSGEHAASFRTAFANGRAFFLARDGLRGRAPVRAEWKGPHQPPGDDVIPADLRVDHVFLVSCKYLSKVLVNPGPQRLFERLLVGEERSKTHWFQEAAPIEYQRLYSAASAFAGIAGLPVDVLDLGRDQQRSLKASLSDRAWPQPLRGPWSGLCDAVASESARRWKAAMSSPRDPLRLLWRMLRITTATYFILGTSHTDALRLRVDSAWDWLQQYELKGFYVFPVKAGQPQVAWTATVAVRDSGIERTVEGHVEIRWSHGRFLGSPEAKVYLDTPHVEVPGYNTLI